MYKNEKGKNIINAEGAEYLRQRFAEIDQSKIKNVKKDKIILPNTITGIIKCTNSKCITNYANEPIAPKFNVINNHPPVVRCHYCEKLIKTEDIEKQFE